MILLSSVSRVRRATVHNLAKYILYACLLFIFSSISCEIRTSVYTFFNDVKQTKLVVSTTSSNGVSPSSKSSSDSQSIVFPLTLTGDYILNNPKICSGVPQVAILVIVHTAPRHFSRRQNIRSTYGSREWYKPEVRLVFLLGLVQNITLQEEIQLEHLKFGDTVQGNFLDSYHNLTHKGVMGFRWITEHCSNVKYVIKVDDDAIVDLWRFIDFFGRRNGGRSLFCSIVYSGTIARKGKWKLENDVMNGTQKWPWPYCPGFVVVLTGDVISLLFQAAHTTPFLWIDDVYLFGYLPHQAGIKIYTMPHNMQLTPKPEGGKCLVEKGHNCTYLAVSVNDDNFDKYWKVIRHRNSKTVTKFRRNH